MSDAFLPIDDVVEAQLPGHATDGKLGSGDRVSLLEAGLLHVEGGRGTFVRWADVLGVLEHAGRAYVLVPRRPPRPPWLSISVALLGDGVGAVDAFAARIRERSAGGGYRDAVRQRRQGLSRTELTDKVRRREAVPGALEVPSTIYLGARGHPLEGPALAGILMGSGAVGYSAIFLLAVAPNADMAGPLAMFLSFAPYVGLIAGAYLAVRVRKAWRAAREAELPRQRVLVLAPDGCMIGFTSGVQTLAWSQVGEFVIGPTEPSYDDGLIVRDADGRKLGEIDGGWLDAPLPLVVAVAEAYREAAL